MQSTVFAKALDNEINESRDIPKHSRNAEVDVHQISAVFWKLWQILPGVPKLSSMNVTESCSHVLAYL